MQSRPHDRYYVGARGVLMERQDNGPAIRTAYCITTTGATRSQIQTLADLLNDPQRGLSITDSAALEQAWALATETPALFFIHSPVEGSARAA